MKIPFTKYHGAGNDFILIDNRQKLFSVDPNRIIHLCHRQYGIGADGLILLEESEVSEASFRIFNPDGNEALMCGNGLRCLAHFFCHLTNRREKCRIASKKHLHNCTVMGNRVTVTLGPPKEMRFSQSLAFLQTVIPYSYINIGVSHFVHFTPDILCSDFLEKAKKLRFHPHFSPEGVNVNFAHLEKTGSLIMRTYERGVEAETLACGTGAASVAIAAWKIYSLSSPIKVKCKSGEILQFDLFKANDILREVEMTGPVSSLFEGTVEV